MMPLDYIFLRYLSVWRGNVNFIFVFSDVFWALRGDNLLLHFWQYYISDSIALLIAKLCNKPVP
ncbi:hypothetical protein B7R74_14525 [Yersinia pseudotuberculosis]|nr:hypothetical protein B7R74_14525 [Yersinia pseudotuberculosis]